MLSAGSYRTAGPFRKTPQIGYTFRNAYDIRYLFTSSHTVLLTDNYFDYSTEQMDMVKLRIEDQFGGIICVWDPENRKKSLQYFLDLLPDLPSESKNTPADTE